MELSILSIVIVSILTIGFIIMIWQVLKSKDNVNLTVNLKKFEMNLRKTKRGP